MEGLKFVILMLAILSDVLRTKEAASVSKDPQNSTLDLVDFPSVSSDVDAQNEMLPIALPRVGIKPRNTFSRGSGNSKKPPPKPSRSRADRVGDKFNDRSKNENSFREKKNRYSKEKVSSGLNKKDVSSFGFGLSEIIYWIIAGVVGFLSMFFSFLCYVIRRMSIQPAGSGNRSGHCCRHHCHY